MGRLEALAGRHVIPWALVETSGDVTESGVKQLLTLPPTNYVALPVFLYNHKRRQ